MAIKREQAAWCLLMLSFVLVVVLGLTCRGSILAYLHGNSRTALLEQAHSFGAQGRHDAARKLYDAIAKRYPGREDVLLAFAEYLDRCGEYDDAETWYARAAATGRQQFSAVRRYTAFLERRGRRDEALAVYADYVQRHPQDAAARLDFGLRLLSRGRFEQCEDHLRVAARNPALRFEAERHLGKAHWQQGNLREAIDIWRRVVSENLEPRRVVYWQDIACAHERLEDWEGACEAWAQYLAHFPNSLMAARRLLEAYERTGAEAQRQAIKLRLRTLEPPIRVERQIAERVVLSGVSEPDSTRAPGDPIVVDVYFRFLGNLAQGQGPEVRFWATGEGQDVARGLVCEPHRLAPTPFWRGDSVRQSFALVLPADLAPGRYRATIGLGPEFSPRVPLFTFHIPSQASAAKGATP